MFVLQRIATFCFYKGALHHKRGCEMLVLNVTFLSQYHLTSFLNKKCSGVQPNVHYNQRSAFFVTVCLNIYCYAYCKYGSYNGCVAQVTLA